jgi:glycosyltransferase involved in cell wall biosynthesis
MTVNQHVLILGFVCPEPNSSAAGGRMVQLISIFKERGFEVTFASSASDSDYMIDLEALGVSKRSIALNCSSFDVFVKELNPTIVLFDRFMMEEQFGWRVAENCPDAIRVLDTEDLHCLRMARQKAFNENRSFSTYDLLVEDVAKREIASILRCDISLMIAEYEMELLISVFKIDSNVLYYLPLLLEPIQDSTIQNLPLFEERKNFVFIGNFLHEPNWNAVQYLKETIWPLIRKQLPEAILQIYGAYPSQKVLQLHKPSEGFYIMGRANEAQEVVRNARVVLAPLRFGAGIKGKLVEAMQCGTPSVTTTIGAESMCGDLPWNGFIADDAQVFADKSVELYQDKTFWLKAQESGFKIIERRYLQSLFADNFVKHILETQTYLKEHRLNNFLGTLLQHHTLTSTKYMSRWIEEKNK